MNKENTIKPGPWTKPKKSHKVPKPVSTVNFEGSFSFLINTYSRYFIFNDFRMLTFNTYLHLFNICDFSTSRQ